MRRRTNYFLRAAFFAPFFAAFLRAPPFFAAFFAPFFAAFFLAAMVLSSHGVERSIEPPVVRTSQWADAGASFHRATFSWRVGDVIASPTYTATLVLQK